MITQINTHIDPELSMWLMLDRIHNDNEESLQIHLKRKNGQTLRTFVGDKMGFTPRFTGYGTFYDNALQQYVQTTLRRQFKELLQQFIKDNPTPIPEQKSMWQKLLDIFR